MATLEELEAEQVLLNQRLDELSLVVTNLIALVNKKATVTQLTEVQALLEQKMDTQEATAAGLDVRLDATEVKVSELSPP